MLTSHILLMPTFGAQVVTDLRLRSHGAEGSGSERQAGAGTVTVGPVADPQIIPRSSEVARD